MVAAQQGLAAVEVRRFAVLVSLCVVLRLRAVAAGGGARRRLVVAHGGWQHVELQCCGADGMLLAKVFARILAGGNGSGTLGLVLPVGASSWSSILRGSRFSG
jgi:hypothetical protein